MELGEELIVYNGHYYTVGTNGAEFVDIPKNAIVFNHKQTEELFKNGKVISDGGRGKIHVNGTAFAEGTAFSSGSGRFRVRSGSSSGGGGGGSSSGGGGGRSSGGGSSSGSSTHTSGNYEYFDWIEIKIARIEREIDNLDRKVNNTFSSWTSRTKSLNDEISKVTSEISVQQKAYDRYIKQANTVKLNSKLKTAVQNGTINIQKYKSDSTTLQAIKDYQTWYEKAIACKDAVEELKQTSYELYKQRFDNIATQYDEILEIYDHQKEMIDNKMNQAETNGYILSNKYYTAMAEREQASIDKLIEERDKLIAERDKAVKDGKLTYHSETYYEESAAIDNIALSIEDAKTALAEYNKTMRETNWKIFDLMLDRITQITDESEFLIKLMEDSDLFDDNGRFTKQGQATLGLHAEDYNIYLEKASKYGAEIAKLDKEIAKDPYNQDLIDRRKELLNLQQESILAANEEKQAIKDLISEGVEKELDALQKLIDKYKDSISSQKDLYDFQKKTKDQAKEIASYEKQMAALQGDTSEEAKAKVQKLKVDLEDAKQELQETEYDKYISDTEDMLDNLFDEYETILNERLDNIDSLIEDVIIATNENASTIKETLQSELKSVGMTLSDEMNAIWNGGSGDNVVSKYTNGISDNLTTITSVVSGIKSSIDTMVSTQDTTAAKESKEALKTYSDSSVQKATTTTAKATNNTTTKASKNNKAEIGDKVTFKSGKYYTNNNGKGGSGNKNIGKTVYIVKYSKGATYPYLISTSTSEKNKLGWVKLNQLKGYATGAKRINKDNMAWTQEKGQEYIIRPSDGAVLTPVAKGDSVLNANASNNIWDMANNPTDFIRDNLNVGSGVNNNVVKNVGGDTLNGNISFELILPNVSNYEELKYAMQHDKGFENMVKSMTVDRVFGGSSLKKYRM